MPQIIAKQDDGSEVDVTEAVQVIYDAMHGYMGAASGSLDKEEWDSVLHLSKAAAFPDYADLMAQRELEERQEAERAEKRRLYEEEREAAREKGRREALALIQAQASIVAQMRHNEPHLADHPDSALWALFQMRKQGRA